MSERGDWELLTEYLERDCHRAFGELVARYAGLVYSAAIRQVRERHAAEDVSQGAFIVLARRARSLKSNVVLGAWLLSVTRFAARDYLKQESRRKKRERIWSQQRTEQMADELPAEGPLDPVLDEAMARLSAGNRDALVLRYFQDKSFEEVAAKLGISEESARQRVSRGLEKLRHILSRKLEGGGIGAQSLGLMLTASAVRAVPEEIVAKLAATALKGGAELGASAALAKGVVAIMAYSKAKAAVLGAAALLLVGGTGASVSYYVMHDSGAVTSVGALADRQQIGTTTTVGPAPQFTWLEPALPGPPKPAYHGPRVEGVVRESDGTPVANAAVMLTYAGRAAGIQMGANEIVITGMMGETTRADGKFVFEPLEEPYSVIVRSDKGIGSALAANIASSRSVIVQRCGRVEGVFMVGTKPLANGTLTVALDDRGQVDPNRGYVSQEGRIGTDSAGRFVVSDVPAGRRLLVGRVPPGQKSVTHLYGFDIPGGKTTKVIAGGVGRVVTGRLVPAPVGCNQREFVLYMQPPEPFYSMSRREQTPEEQKRMAESPEYRAFLARNTSEKTYFLDLNEDGTFHLDDVVPGNYGLSVRYGIRENGARMEAVGSAEMEVKIAAAPAEDSDEAQNLGDIYVKLARRLKVGEAATELIASDAEGKLVKLSGFRGRYVLLSIVYGTDQNWRDAQKLVGIFDRFGDDRRFTMLTINGGWAQGDLKSAADTAGINWPILKGDSKPDGIPEEYRSSGQGIFLIDPQGRVAAKNLTPPRAWYTVDQALSKSLQQPTGILVRTEKIPAMTPAPTFSTIPQPVSRNAATNADFRIVDGLCGVDVKLLHDGEVQQQFDDPNRSFRFHLGTFEGRVKIDLHQAIPIARVNTYSRHNKDRGPQLYRLFASNGDSPDFNPAPKIGTDPAACGWTKIATVDTRPGSGPVGGWYGASISGESGSIGRYRYLLFEMFPTETVDAYGHTFYGEIQVIEVK